MQEVLINKGRKMIMIDSEVKTTNDNLEFIKNKISIDLDTIAQVEGAIEKVNIYGGGIFIRFKNKNVYKLELCKYTSDVVMDGQFRNDLDFISG